MQQLFEQEFKKHEKALFLVAVSYVHNTEDAKDIPVPKTRAEMMPQE